MMEKQRIIVWCDYDVYPEEWQLIATNIRKMLRDELFGKFSNVLVYVETVDEDDEQ